MNCFDRLQQQHFDDFNQQCKPYNDIYNYFIKYYEICILVRMKDHKLFRQELLTLLQKKRERFLTQYYNVKSKYKIRRNWSFENFNSNMKEHSYLAYYYPKELNEYYNFIDDKVDILEEDYVNILNFFKYQYTFKYYKEYNQLYEELKLLYNRHVPKIKIIDLYFV